MGHALPGGLVNSLVKTLTLKVGGVDHQVALSPHPDGGGYRWLSTGGIGGHARSIPKALEAARDWLQCEPSPSEQDVLDLVDDDALEVLLQASIALRRGAQGKAA